jgi:hypothetical protein
MYQVAFRGLLMADGMSGRTLLLSVNNAFKFAVNSVITRKGTTKLEQQKIQRADWI